MNQFKRQRTEIAAQAAKLLAEDGRLDYFSAKQKALKKSGVVDNNDSPSNQEIEDQLKLYQSLSNQSERNAIVRKIREDALLVMGKFEEFSPLLVGAVLEGTAIENSPIELHVFPDSIKDVTMRLIESNIQFEPIEKRLRLNKHEVIDVPTMRFYVGKREIEMSVLNRKMLHQKPMSPITLHPMKRANITKVSALISG